MSDAAPFAPIDGLDRASSARLAALPVMPLAQGAVLFRPGDSVEGFAIVLSGRIEVFLTGPSGREILLYAVEPGQSCVQSTLGLMGDAPCSGEAITACETRVAMIPRGLFLELMDQDAGFRRFVMQAFARRMQDVTSLLERVAFGRVECRLAAALLDLARDGCVGATHAELATRIGTAREVVSRRLEAFARKGWIQSDRGAVRLQDIAALRQLAAALL